MKKISNPLLIICLLLIMIACTPAEQQTAVIVQSDINQATPIAIEAAQTGLSLAGQPAPASLLGVAAPIVEQGQKVLLLDLQQNVTPSPVPAVTPTPAPGK